MGVEQDHLEIQSEYADNDGHDGINPNIEANLLMLLCRNGEFVTKGFADCVKWTAWANCLLFIVSPPIPSFYLVSRLSQASSIYQPNGLRGLIPWRRLALMLTAWFLLQPTESHAQDEDLMPRLRLPDQMPDVLAPGIRPDAVIMRNGMGESIFVPRSRYEEFERFLRSENKLPTENAVNALTQMQVSVQVDGAVAKLVVDAKASVSEPNSHWLSVPIGLGLAQVIPSWKSGEVASEFPPLRIASDNSGYVWRVSPGPAGARELHFEGVSNVQTSPQGQTLRLDLTSAPTVVRFELPIGQWELNAYGNGSEVVEPFEELGSTSVANVRTQGGRVTLVWAKKSVAAQIQAVEVESVTKYVQQLESSGFRATANLAIRGPKALGGRRFLITLPEGSQWREPLTAPTSFPGYRFGRSESESDKTKQVLLLEFEEAFSRSEIEMPIEWQSSNQVDSKSRDSDATSFSMLRVEGTQRHFGTIDVVVPRNVSFRWMPQVGIQFVRQTLLNDGSESFSYTFRFNQQNEPLIGRWKSGEIASDLKAMYGIVCDPSGIRLSGSIDIFGDVRLLPFLQLDVRGWTVDRVQFQPSGRDLDLAAIQSRSPQNIAENPQKTLGNPQNITSIPLSLGELLDANQLKNGTTAANRTQPESIGPLDASPSIPLSNTREDSTRSAGRGISFVLSRPMEKKQDLQDPKMPIAFSLPMLSWLDTESQQRLALCVGGDVTVQSSSLRLEPSDGLPKTLKPMDEQIGKPSDATVSMANAMANQSMGRQSMLRYRLANSESWLDWNGTSEPLGTTIHANADTNVTVTTEAVAISQTWSLACSGGVAQKLRIAVSKEWFNDESGLDADADELNKMQVSVDGVSVSAKPIGRDQGELPYSDSSSLDRRMFWLQIDLPEAKMGADSKQERTIVLRKRMGHREQLSTSPTAFSWLLPSIATDSSNDTIIANNYSGRIILDARIRCVLQSSLGEPNEKPIGLGSDQSVISFNRTQLEPRLVGSLSLKTIADESACDIESVWLQTIVNAVEQRDRFVVRLRTKGSSVSLSIPANRIANAEILVNGRKASTSVNSNNINRVDIALAPTESEAMEPTERTFVLEVFLWSTKNSQWLKSLQVESPSIMNCKSRAPLIWQIVVPTTVHLIGNTSTLSPGYQWRWKDLWFRRTSDLNQETIASQIGASSQRFVSEQTNQYVFFSLDHTVAMKAWTAPRTLLWAPVALFVLVGSFLIMEFKWIRRPWVGILLLLASLAFSQWMFDLSIALSQCFVAAILVAVLYAILKWVVDRRARRRSVFVSRPSSPMISIAGRAPSQSGSAVLPSPIAAVATLASGNAVVESQPSTTIAPESDGGK